ncbi:MAG: hypothetical protein M3133_02965 [Actinomycetota bacterium]|nr:hypothetical protein [Actinomycetota bacterium]
MTGALLGAAVGALLGVVVGLIVGAQAFDDEEPLPPLRPMESTLEEIVDEPQSFLGKATFISGQVKEILSPRAFTVSPSVFSGPELLVVSKAPLAAPTGRSATRPVLEGDSVHVAGEVRRFDRPGFERDLDTRLGREFDSFLGDDLDEREGDPAIRADHVTFVSRTTPIVEASEAEQIVNRPGDFYGNIVSVTGRVSDVRPSGALVIDGELLALTADFAQGRPQQGERVRIVGPVRPFDPDQFRAEGVPDDELLGDFANRPAVVAQSIEVEGSERRAVQTAEQFAEQTEEVAGEVGLTARRLVESPQAREDAVQRLEQQEQRARRLADRVRDELPPQEAARQGLVEANERTAMAAARLQEFARSEDNEQALAAARADLGRARAAVSRVIDDLGARLSPEGRRRLGELLERVPEIPEPRRGG